VSNVVHDDASIAKLAQIDTFSPFKLEVTRFIRKCFTYKCYWNAFIRRPDIDLF